MEVIDQVEKQPSVINQEKETLDGSDRPGGETAVRNKPGERDTWRMKMRTEQC